MATERIDIVISERGSRKVSRNIEKIGKSSRAAQGGVSLLRSALGALGGALILRNTIKTLATFEQSMSTIKAITGDVGEGFKALRDTAKELGIQTRFSATQAADAMIFLSRTGFDAGEVLASVRDTLDLAQVGMLDLGRAADIASNVLKGFRLEAADMGRVVDVLAKTSSSANTTVEQLGDAMSFAAPAAAALGITMEETAAFIGVLSDAGIQGSRAGAGLRTTFIKLLKPTGEAKQLLLDMGLTTADLDIKTRGLIPVIETLALKQTELAEAATFASTRQAAQLLIIIESLPRVKELLELNQQATGTARKMATVMDDNLNGALLRVKSALEGVVLAFGASGATNSLRTLVEKTAEGLRLLAKNVNVLIPAIKTLAFVLGTLLAKGALVFLITQVKALSTAMLVLASRTLPLVTTAVVAAFLTIALAADASGKTIKETFEELKVEIKKLLSGLLDAALLDAQPFTDRIVSITNNIKNLGGFANLTQKKLGSLTDELITLQASITGELEFANFLNRGGDAANDLRIQLLSVELLQISIQKRLKDSNSESLKVTIRPGAGGAGGRQKKEPIAFRDLLRDLRREGELLKLNNNERAIRETLFAAEDAREKKLTIAQKALIQTLVANNLELERHNDILDKINEPQEIYKQGLIDINKLLKINKITSGEASDAVNDLRLAFLETQTDMVSGFERAFLKIGREVEDWASLSERLMVDAFKGAEDAFVDFVTTGKLSFRDFADSIIADLAMMAIRAQITEPLFKAFGNIFSNISFGGGAGAVAPPPGAGVLGAHGGLLRGPGTGTSDSIPTLLSHGEFVTNAQNTAIFLPLLQAINSFSGGQRGGGGGRRGGGVVVQVIDQRGSQAAPVERRERTGGDGTKTITLIIRDIVKRQVASGGLDSPIQARFGLTPVTR